MADYFCCPSDTTCLVLAEKTTALCCPKGASCDTISPIICDITAQDVIENPTSPIHTTKLKESLPSCGGRCCPFGYTCRGGSACVLDQEQKSPTSMSVLPTTSTKTTTSGTQAATQAATSTHSESLPAVSTPSTGLGQEAPTPSATVPTETSAAATSAGNSTSGSIIAGTTVAAVASVAGLTFLLWFKRRSISEKVGSVRLPRPWKQLREQVLEQGVSLPRYNSPPPAYTMEMMKAPPKHTEFRHYSPESIGNVMAVELPATPVSFSMWNVRSEGEARRPRSHYLPYRRP
ncbi:GPI transamidase component pig-S/T [Colletotrichum tofieldiae]|nr:GPI transamidase component pig-S/T [Colletotrichum tofieldiae]GKT78012.1 GPI transamidase component pig-S/T [Colletotrichum tofieldiae]